MSLDLLIDRAERVLTMDGSSANPLGGGAGLAIGVVGERIAWIGPSHDAPAARTTLDAVGHLVMPGLIDAHTHTIWAGSRSDEFRRRLAGESYTAILEGGGGILSTVRATRAASEDELVALGVARLGRMRARGVTTVEIKGGYGLNVTDEVKMLRAARTAGTIAGVDVVTTFLGAHAIPAEHRADRDRYVDEIVHEQLPAVLGLADACDVYVDRGAFTVEEGQRILAEAQRLGLDIKAHAEQVAHTGIAAAAARMGALSCDHLERVDDDGIAAMARSGTVAVLLPAAMLYLRDVAPPVAALRAAGVPMAVATDLNPGSSPSDDLWIAATLACVTMGLTVEEALLGVTRHAATALGLRDRGRLVVGARADLAIVRPPAGEPAEPAALVQHLGGATCAARVVRGAVDRLSGATSP